MGDASIDAMSAGPALDRLVAERVMGRQVRRAATGDEAAWFLLDGNGTTWEREENAWRYGGLPAYSVDLADARAVVERMAPREVRLRRVQDGRWCANIDHQPMNAVEATAPLAICRAALMAVRT